jgi:SAM-dependent methyltransferase
MNTRLQHRVRESRDRRFDRQFNVDTSGVVPMSDLALPHPTWKHGVRYEAIDADICRRLIAALDIAHETFTFVDLGSGKGRALLIAAEYPFREIIGVEFAPPLHEVAERNLRSYRNPRQRCRAIRSVCADAIRFELPPDNLVLFLSNPFGEPVMAPVIANLRQSFAARPRPMAVLYFNPTCGHLFDEVEFLEQRAAREWYRIYTTAHLRAPRGGSAAGHAASSRRGPVMSVAAADTPGAYSIDGSSPGSVRAFDQPSRVRMLISEVSVRCTGHISAISRSRWRCSELSAPRRLSSVSIRSSLPSLVSQSAQSAAWIFVWLRVTLTASSGHCLRRAYSATVMEVQAPSAASNRS